MELSGKAIIVQSITFKEENMIRSMTGFGRAHEIIDGREILVEIRSVNHRYYEFNAKLPRAYMYLEDKLKSLLQGKITRGKVEVSVSVYSVCGKEAEVTVNKNVIEGYISAVRSVKDEFKLADDLSLSHILTLPDAFNVLKPDADEEEIWACVSQTATVALDKFVIMRENEGIRMRDDILSRLELIENHVAEIEVLSPANVAEYRSRLYERIKEVIASATVDEQRILTEAAIFAEKTAVDEETVRLKSHIAQFRQMISGSESVGRKLDFLVQELNREANTIGSKAQDLEITRRVVDIKSEIEKIREQIQNIE